MGRLLLRTAAIAGVVVLALVLWVVIARPVSMFLDRFRTAEIESHPILALGFDIRDSDTGSIQIDDRPMSLMPANDQLLPLHVEISESGDFAVTAGPSSITLGHAKQSSVDPNIFSVKPAAADRTVFRIGRSMMSWPTPLAFNFMTGHSPSWKRHNYYELVWQKQNGSRLKMVWRYEQYFYDSWASGFMVRDGITGLIRAEIRP